MLSLKSVGLQFYGALQRHGHGLSFKTKSEHNFYILCFTVQRGSSAECKHFYRNNWQMNHTKVTFVINTQHNSHITSSSVHTMWAAAEHTTGVCPKSRWKRNILWQQMDSVKQTWISLGAIRNLFNFITYKHNRIQKNLKRCKSQNHVTLTDCNILLKAPKLRATRLQSYRLFFLGTRSKWGNISQSLLSHWGR